MKNLSLTLSYEEREQEQICCSQRSPAPPSLAGNRSLDEEVGGLGQSYPMDFGVQAWWVRHRESWDDEP
jgi:hypothetical protein